MVWEEKKRERGVWSKGGSVVTIGCAAAWCRWDGHTRSVEISQPFVRVIVRKISVYSCRKSFLMNWLIYMLKYSAPIFLPLSPCLIRSSCDLTSSLPIFPLNLAGRGDHLQIKRVAACMCWWWLSCWLLVLHQNRRGTYPINPGKKASVVHRQGFKNLLIFIVIIISRSQPFHLTTQ